MKTSAPRHLRRSALLVEDVVFHDADRVAALLIDRLHKGGSKLGYRLSPQEQRLLAVAIEMYAITQGSVYTADFELKAKRNGANGEPLERPAVRSRNGKRPQLKESPVVARQLRLDEDDGA